MKIVQSFWSGKRSLLENSFGWITPQHHVMGWALSCLRLHSHYEDLHLYTDTAGYEILVRYLDLPYKEVHVCYDEIDHYQPTLWALPKILTYRAQKEPFIHVDGDVFIWKEFDEQLQSAGLIAQNRETGTSYYKELMNGIKSLLGHLPESLRLELSKESISSYNAGIMGGADLSFFEKYTGEALDLVNRNYADMGQGAPSVNFNILFEQVLFYVMTRQEQKEVACLFKESFDDNGYDHRRLADFSSVPYKSDYLHLVGKHKINKGTCEMMARTLFKEYPSHFYKIMTLFRNDHVRYYTAIKEQCPQLQECGMENKDSWAVRGRFRTRLLTAHVPDSPLIKFVVPYEQQLAQHIDKWEEISAGELYALEKGCIDNASFFLKPCEEQMPAVIGRNPYFELIETSFDWTGDLNVLVGQQDVLEAKDVNIACVPRLFFDGYAEVSLDDLDYNILALLDDPLSLEMLLQQLEACFSENELTTNYQAVYDLVLLKLKRLYYSHLIILS